MITPEEQKMYEGLLRLGAWGWLAGMGAMLASKETLTGRMVLGRTISSFTLGVSSTALLALFPDMDISLREYVLAGTACTLGSLGTSGVQIALGRVVSKWP